MARLTPSYVAFGAKKAGIPKLSLDMELMTHMLLGKVAWNVERGRTRDHATFPNDI